MLREALPAWRDAAGRLDGGRPWSQKELARRAGVSHSLIALIETGDRQPSLRNAIAIAKAFGVPVKAFAVIHADIEEAVA